MAAVPTTLSHNRLLDSLNRGIEFLLRQQRADGAFNYEYNWREKVYLPDDNPVRQAGTLWGLALAHHYDNDAKIFAACVSGLEFFHRHSALTANGGRFVKYPAVSAQRMGTVALLALTLIELLRSPTGTADARQRGWRTSLDQYIQFLLDGQNSRGLWHSRYDDRDGSPCGEPSAFFDGEALLALVKAAKYLHYGHLCERVMRAAAAGYRHNVLLALNKKGKGRSVAHGYYQWGMMAFCELIDSDWPEVEQYVEPVYYLADARTRGRESKNNPGAVLEGLIHAYAVAIERDPRRAENYRGTIVRDLSRMLSLQAGNPATVQFLSPADDDEAAAGGFQHYPDQPTLRIDFTQHAIHALLLGIKQTTLLG